MGLYPFTFRAAILEENRRPLKIDQVVFRGPLQTGQVLVKLFYSGICGKQIEEIDGSGGPDPFLPHLLGHEGSGEVLDTGPGVTKVKKGDTVVMHWRKGSGIHSPTPVYERQGTGERIHAGWVTTFNEYAVVSENRVTPIDKNSDMVVAALCGCVVTTGAGVVMNKADVGSHDTVVIFGCGGIGLMAVQAARLCLPRKLIAVDINPQALKAAEKFGATDTVNPQREDAIKKVYELTDNRGANKVLMCTGNIKALEMGVEMTSVPGTCYFVGVPPKGEKVAIHAHAVMHERNILGTLGGDSFPDRDIPMFYDLYRRGQLPVRQLVSYIGSFEDIHQAIEKMRGDTPGRCVVKFNH